MSEFVEEKYLRGKAAAAKKKRVWNISFDDYVDLVSEPCAYCEDFHGFPLIDSPGYSLDRVDNRKGYLLSNVVPCCAICNGLKRGLLSGDEMLEVSAALIQSRTRGNWTYHQLRRSISYQGLNRWPDYIDFDNTKSIPEILERISHKGFIDQSDKDILPLFLDDIKSLAKLTYEWQSPWCIKRAQNIELYAKLRSEKLES